MEYPFLSAISKRGAQRLIFSSKIAPGVSWSLLHGILGLASSVKGDSRSPTPDRGSGNDPRPGGVWLVYPALW